MDHLGFLVQHGYLVLFAWVLAEHLGLPLPAVPFLLAAGALAGGGKLDLALVVATATGAAVMSDLAWYAIGRRHGEKVLRLLCRISLERESCVRRTENSFARHGAPSLLVTKFVPGLNVATTPLAGIARIPLSRFLLFDGLGALLWAGTFVGLGYLFSRQIELIARQASRFEVGLVVVLAVALTAYVAWRYLRRQRFVRGLRIAASKF